MREISPAQISFLGPCFAINVPKNIFTMELVINRKLSFNENALREMLLALVIAFKNILLEELQKPRDTKTIKADKITITQV